MIDGNYDGNVPVGNNIGRALLRAIRIKSSKTEVLHLFVATLLVTGVGLSFNHYRHISWQFLAVFIGAFLILGLGSERRKVPLFFILFK